MLILEQVNRLDPHDADARRRLAAFYERAGQLESVQIWREAVALDPQDVSTRLGLARAAIRFGDRSTAAEALDQLSRTAESNAEFHRLRAALALLERDPAAHARSLAALARLDPADERIRLNLAAVELADPDSAPAARAALLTFARGDRLRMRAVAELLGDVARRWPTPSPERERELQRLAAELTPARGPLLALPSQVDHIDRLVQYAMEQPAPEPEDVLGLANWMSLNGQTEAALQWIDTLPSAIRDSAVLRIAQAEFAVRVGDWNRLRALLVGGIWGPVPAEAVEQVFRARGRPEATATAWQAALEAAKGSPPGLRVLLRLADTWQLRPERRQVLLAIARLLPGERWAWRQLIAHALERSDSDQVWQTYQEWRRAAPADPVVQVESAIMAALLGRRAAPGLEETATYMASQPADPGAAVAHALALRRAGRVHEAAAVLDTQAPGAFREPRYALARAVVLAEAGRAAESEQLLSQLKGVPLLREEQALVAASHERNGGAR